MRFRLRALAAFGCLAIIASSSTTYSATIYSDDFSGSGAVLLNGTAPDVRPGSETWSAAISTAANDDRRWYANGSKPASTTSTSGSAGLGNGNAFLPFVPETGKIYTLSILLDPQTVAGTRTDDWFAFGFMPSTATTTAVWPTAATNPWVFLRVDNTHASALAFGGGSPSSVGSAPAGPLNLEIVLNTQSAQWTVDYFVGGAVTPASSLTYGTNPTITQVGFGAFRQAIGTVDNFSLTVVPEPTSIFLVFCSAMALGLIRTRRGRQVA